MLGRTAASRGGAWDGGCRAEAGKQQLLRSASCDWEAELRL